ncbi:MAG: MbnP family protein [Ginsengibacter sp.]
MRIKKNGGWLLVAFSCIILTSFQHKKNRLPKPYSTLKITFHNTVKKSKVVLYDSSYTNPFGEEYTINKFRYYVSNISLKSDVKDFEHSNHFYLIDEKIAKSQSFSFPVPEGNYKGINFLLGVDSLHNVSGAQTDVLDPAKDMFWTWNTGYVMAKLEGNSPASNLVNHKYEFHVGGFSGKYNVLKNIELNFPEKKSLHLAAGKTTEIIINADVDAWWQNPNDIKIAEKGNINAPGKWALAISDNYAKMFHIQKIISD